MPEQLRASPLRRQQTRRTTAAPIESAVRCLRAIDVNDLNYESYKAEGEKPAVAPRLTDFPLWLKIGEEAALIVAGLCLFAYFVPDQNLLPTWTLIPAYPVQIGLSCLVLSQVRLWVHFRRVLQHRKSHNSTGHGNT